MALSQFFESVIRAAGAEALTEIFIGILIVVLVLAIILKKLGKRNAFTQYTPTLLTSIGMLGTFMGIVAGLLEFNTADIDGSIALLLAGLKTAFMTSLVGMCFSILFKMLSISGFISSRRSSEQPAENINNGHLYAAMQQQIESIKDLKKAIGGDNDNSLVGQFKLMRSDLTDGQRKTERAFDAANEYLQSLNNTTLQQQQKFTEFEQRLWLKLQEFADMMSKSATEQVIEALKTVIQDFNNNLTEQFGENFKQLNAAVLKLVEWQENYKNQLSDMKDQYDHGVQAITQTETSVAHIAERSSAIPDTMEKLKTVIDVNQHQLNGLSAHLSSFSDLRDNALQAIPEIQQQITYVLDGAKEANNTMKQGVIEATEQMTGAVKTSSEHMSLQVEDSSNKLIIGIDDSTNTLINAVNSSSTKLTDSVVDSANTIKETVTTAAKDYQSAINEVSENLNNLSTGVKESIQTISKEFTDTITSIKGGNKELIDGITTANSAMIDGFKKAEAEISKLQSEFIETAGKTSQELIQESTKVLSSLENNIDSAIKQTLEKTSTLIEQEMTNISNATSQHCTDVLQKFADNLAAITGQFTSDYKSLIREMEQVMREVREMNR